jgi:mannose-6-phosphate isomerase-like protein (cupin superfamily)
MAGHGRGRLRNAGEAPRDGEATFLLAEVGGVAVEQILSGRLDGPVDDVADVDEWVLVVEGRAVLEVAGDHLELRAGDWLLLPARTPHRLLSTEPGTSWLTVTGRD